LPTDSTSFGTWASKQSTFLFFFFPTKTDIILAGNNIYMTGEGEGWRDVRENMGLNRSLDLEDDSQVPLSHSDEGQRKLMNQEMDPEEISDLLTDEAYQEQDEEQAVRDNDAWAAHSISQDLQNHYEKTDEYWVLEASQGGLEPVFVVKDDQVISHPDYAIEGTDVKMEVDGKEYDGHPFGILKYAGDEDLLLSRDFDEDEDLSVPIDERFSCPQYERLSSSYFAPGLADDYRQAAEEVEEEFYGE
jgi:hypothetical protein